MWLNWSLATMNAMLQLIYIYIYIKLRFLAFLSSIFPSEPNKPNLIYQNFLFRNCFGFQMCKVLWVSLLCAWSKPKWLSTCCGALITQRQLLNWRKIHSMLFFSQLMIVAIAATEALVVFISHCWWWPWVFLSWNNSQEDCFYKERHGEGFDFELTNVSLGSQYLSCSIQFFHITYSSK